MKMDVDEVEKSLSMIKQIQRAESMIGRRETGLFLIIWGIVWFVGFLMSHYLPSSSLLWVWLALTFAGALFSAAVGMKLGQQVQYTQTGSQMSLFYPLIIGFSFLWLYLAQPTSWQQTAVLAITFIGFAVVMNGVLLKERPFIVVGLIGTILAVIAYLLLQQQFGLIMALVGGGGMILAGLKLFWQGQGYGQA